MVMNFKELRLILLAPKLEKKCEHFFWEKKGKYLIIDWLSRSKFQPFLELFTTLLTIFL